MDWREINFSFLFNNWKFIQIIRFINYQGVSLKTFPILIINSFHVKIEEKSL